MSYLVFFILISLCFCIFLWVVGLSGGSRSASPPSLPSAMDNIDSGEVKYRQILAVYAVFMVLLSTQGYMLGADYDLWGHQVYCSMSPFPEEAIWPWTFLGRFPTPPLISDEFVEFLEDLVFLVCSPDVPEEVLINRPYNPWILAMKRILRYLAKVRKRVWRYLVSHASWEFVGGVLSGVFLWWVAYRCLKAWKD